MTPVARIAQWLSALPQSRRRVMAGALVVVVAAAVAGAVLLTGNGSRHVVGLPPTPPSPAATPSIGAVGSSAAAASAPTTRPTPATCTRGAAGSGVGAVGAPARICIPSIGVDASVMSLGLNRDGTVEVPPLSRVRDAGWYRYSAPAGAVGPTVILGHVDSAQYGAGVFFRLGQLHAGDTVAVDRADGRTATYRITTVVEVSKKSFPTEAVYGPTSGPALRLVTCGGRFDASTGNYEDNIIASGTLVSLSAS